LTASIHPTSLTYCFPARPVIREREERRRTMLSSALLRASSRATTRPASLRALSTAAEHRPPVDLHGIHARYANATYIAASKQGVLDAVESELLAVKASASNSVPFRYFLDNPLISRDNKEAQVKSMMEGKVSDVTFNLMTTLAGNARLSEVTKIADTYVELMKARRGEVEVTITSADKLSKTHALAIEAALKTQIGEGKKVLLSTQVDPTILGGLQIQIGDKFLDLSVGGKIETLGRTAV